MREISLASGNSQAVALAGEPVLARSEQSSKLKTVFLVLAVVLLNALGDLALAWGMRRIPTVSINPLGYIQAMLNPFVALGVCLLILWLLTRMALLSWADLSFVLPLTGVGYILAAIFGKVFLKESITPVHWLGTVLIFVGTGLVGSTNHKSEGLGAER